MSAIRSAASRLSRVHQTLGFSRFSVTHFLISLGLLIFITPFIDRPPYGDEVEGVVMTAVLLLGALAVGGRRKMLLAALALSITAVAIKWLQHFLPQSLPEYCVPAISLIFMGLVIFELMRFILLAPTIDREVISAAMASYVSLGLLWTFAYQFVSIVSPHSFAVHGNTVDVLDPYDAFYFSYVTLLTVGYGDITPVSRVAKMLAILEGMTGMFYVVTLISRLVAMYGSTRGSRH